MDSTCMPAVRKKMNYPWHIHELSYLIDLTDTSSLLSNGLVFVQNTNSSFLPSTTNYNFVIGSKINKKQFRVREYWNITFICTRHAKIR